MHNKKPIYRSQKKLIKETFKTGEHLTTEEKQIEISNK